MKIIRLFVVLLICLLLVFAVMGCSGKSDSPTPQKSTTDGLKKPTSKVGAEGKELVEIRCTVCHSPERIQTAQHDRAGWENTVGKMIGKGADLNQEERQKVVKYLSDN